MRQRPMIPVRISAIPETDRDNVTVTVAANGRDIRLPRKSIDFTPGHVILPAWLFKTLKRYLVHNGTA